MKFRRMSLVPLAALALAAVSAGAEEARTVRYAPRDIIDISCKLRNTTMILLPQGEKVLDLVVGDRDMWLLEGTDRYAYVKPAGAGLSTTINLIAESGNVYTFHAHEVSNQPSRPADIKVFVELSDPSQFAAVQTGPRYVSAAEHDALRAELQAEQERAAREREEFAFAYPTRVAWDYSFQRNRKPFFVSEIWHDDKATYIRCKAKEKPTLYEMTDGKPTLINYDLRGDVYIVPKVLDYGRLTIGKKSFAFLRRDS